MFRDFLGIDEDDIPDGDEPGDRGGSSARRRSQRRCVRRGRRAVTPHAATPRGGPTDQRHPTAIRSPAAANPTAPGAAPPLPPLRHRALPPPPHRSASMTTMSPTGIRRRRPFLIHRCNFSQCSITLISIVGYSVELTVGGR